MKVSGMKMYRNKSLTMTLLLGLAVVGCFLPLQVQAQANSMTSLVSCLNGLGPNATVVDAVACVPNGCYWSNTLSEESAQPGCTLRDGTRLPRVLFSCAGPGNNQILRFRPSFSLCTQGGIIDHIEVGQDIRHDTTDDPGLSTTNVQEMADVAPPYGSLTQFGTGATAIVDTRSPANSKGCRSCHDNTGAVATVPATFNLFRSILIDAGDGTIGTNDPTVAPPLPGNAVPLSVICSDIANSSQLARNPTQKAKAVGLCNALLAKQQ